MQSNTYVQLIKARGLEPRGFIRFDPLAEPVAERDGACRDGVAAEFGNDFGQRRDNEIDVGLRIVHRSPFIAEPL